MNICQQKDPTYSIEQYSLYLSYQITYMKKISSLLFISLGLILFFSSCKKENKTADLSGKLKTVAFSDNQFSGFPYTQYFFYNDNGQLSNYYYKNAFDVAYGYTTFQYSTNKVSLTQLQVAPSSNYTEERFFTDGGKVDSIVQGNTNSAERTHSKLLYNSQDQLIEMKYYYSSASNTIPAYSYSELLTYEQQNISMVKFTNQDEYFKLEYSSHDSNINGAPGDNLYTINKKLINRVFKLTSLDPTPQLLSTMEYIFDSNDRVERETTTYYSNGLPTGQLYSRTFTYY